MGLLAVLAAALGFAALYPRGRPFVLALLRALGVLALALLALNPTLWSHAEGPRVLALVDTSRSMDGAKPPPLPYPKLYFSGEPRFPPADAYLLWSDGLWELGKLPEAPVYPIIPEKPRGKGVRVRSIVGPRRLSVGEEAKVSVWAEAAGEFEGRLRAWVNGKPALDTAVKFEGTERFSLSLVPEKEGPVRVKVKLGDAQALWQAWASEGGLKLKLVAWEPSPAVGAVRRALLGAAGVRFKSFVRAGSSWLELSGDTVKKVSAPSFDADALVLIEPPPRVNPNKLSFTLRRGALRGGLLKPGPDSPFPESLLKELPPVERVPKLGGKPMLLAGRAPALVETEKGLEGALELWRPNLASGGQIFKIALSYFLDKVRSEKAGLWVWVEPPQPAGAYWVWAETDAPDAWVQVGGRAMDKEGEGLFSAGPFTGTREFEVSLVKAGKVIKSRKFKVEVKPRPEEPSPFVDTARLGELAEATGGKLIKDPAELSLKPRKRPVRAAEAPWLALFGFGALLLEWGLRRWRGLS